MVALFIVSVPEASGKTAVGIGFGRRLRDEGKKVGFLRPVRSGESPEKSAADAGFAKKSLGLTEDVRLLNPALAGGKALADQTRKAYIEVSQNKDVVIIEGYCGKTPNDENSQTAYEIARALKAKVIAVENYARGKSAPQYIDSYLGFGENLLGFLLNRVPKNKLKRTGEELSSRLAGSKMAIIGVLPEARPLVAFTVGELAEQINGQLLDNGEKAGELVENVMVGAMYVDSGLDYFSRKAGKAAVVRNERPDMQMAALETATRCLVITGSGEPMDYVRFKAEEKDVPVITTQHDTDTVIRHIEDLLDATRFNQEKKLNRLAEVLQANIDFKTLYAGLGLT